MADHAEWKPWTYQEAFDALPEVLAQLEARLPEFPVEYKEKNESLIRTLRSEPLTLSQISEGTRTNELFALGFALDALARSAASSVEVEERLRTLRAAHELFRAAGRSLTPTKPMRQSMINVVRLLLPRMLEQARTGAIDAGEARAQLNSLFDSAWGQLPPQVELTVNELLFQAFEELRKSGENDSVFHDRFVRDNIEAILEMEIPTRLKETRKEWERIAEHVAPSAVRVARQTLRQPANLSELISDIRPQLADAVERGDPHALMGALESVENQLETNLGLRLDAKPEYREPVSELRHGTGLDKFFVEARELLLREDSRALGKFSDIHFRRGEHTVAKEWYAFAIARFGQRADVHEIIHLLREVTHSDYYRPEYGWGARWNLACALRQLEFGAGEALDELRPILDIDAHPAEAFELCLLWALEQDREDVLSLLYRRAPYYEAHLLSALNDARAIEADKGRGSTFHEQFRRIGRILRDPDLTFPEPRERLQYDVLDRLTRDFIETSLVDAGIEWFRQRLFYQSERTSFKNWDCAALLHEANHDLKAAWRCRERSWTITSRNKKLDARRKSRVLVVLLQWAQRHDFHEEALKVLSRSWREAGMAESEMRIWDRRLRPSAQNDATGQRVTPSPGEAGPTAENYPTDLEGSMDVGQPSSPETDQVRTEELRSTPSMTVEKAEREIQAAAGEFGPVGDIAALAAKADVGRRLLDAVASKHADASSKGIAALGEVLRLAGLFATGVEESDAQRVAEDLKGLLDTIRLEREGFPYELKGLAQACERVIQRTAVRIKAVPELTITPPNALQMCFAPPERGSSYTTRCLTRLANPGPEPMTTISVSFMTTAPFISFIQEPVLLQSLAPDEKRVVECALRISEPTSDLAEIRVHATYQVAGVVRTSQAAGAVSIRPFEHMIPVTERFTPDNPVSIDRTDLFHGRDRELKELAAAFSGGRLRRLNFVNGIRRVGKSTLMQQLGARSKAAALPLLLNMETALASRRMDSAELVRRLMSQVIEELDRLQVSPSVVLQVPSPSVFDTDTPWTVFENLVRQLKTQLADRTVLLCFDEIQHIVRRIADPDDPMDAEFLSWLRDKIQRNWDIWIVCTASEPYEVIRDRFREHHVWGNVQPYDISFVDFTAMKMIATIPLKPDKVTWLPEALDTLWDMTEGHPWVIQSLAAKVAERLNAEHRRIVGPSDVEWAADARSLVSQIPALWWNEDQGQITPPHRQIAFIILRRQVASRRGIPESDLVEAAQNAGLRSVGKYLEQMKRLEVLSEFKEEDKPFWRIRGAFLERYVVGLMSRASQDASPTNLPKEREPLALMVDWENVKISLAKELDKMPEAKKHELRPRLEARALAARLMESASRHGVVRQSWAVADWDRPFFQGDQKAVRNSRFVTDIAGAEKAEASDHVLKEKIHFVLREHGEVTVFVIGTGDGDYLETVRTLEGNDKKVVLWATRDAINRLYGDLLAGQERILIEWLEDIVFGETQQ